MKRVLQLVLVSSGIVALNLVTVVILLGLVGGIGLSAAGPPNDGCGDVNGDGTVDISDPITLLSHIFEGQPLACAQPISSGAILTADTVIGVTDVGGFEAVEYVIGDEQGDNPNIQQAPVPRSGTLKNLTVYHWPAAFSNGEAMVTVLVNGVDTPLSVTTGPPGSEYRF